jgi:ribose-phosphate pyrophosphokinase
MDIRIVAGSGNVPLAEVVAASLGVALVQAELTKFPDGEQHVRLLDSVRGAGVFLVQPTGPPVDSHLVELLLLADAVRRAGAERITAVIPYFGYARQDRRAQGREALAARLAADMIAVSGVDGIAAVDVHTRTMEGFFSVPFDHISAVPLLLRELLTLGFPPDAVVVSPDLGAVKLAERFAKELALPVAVVRKSRLSGAEVAVTGVTGNVRGRAPIIVDDMISTGGTIKAAGEALRSAGARDSVTVVATHGVFAGNALERLRGDWLDRVIVTDSVPQPAAAGLPLHVVSIASLLADAIGRLYRRESLSGLISYE